VIGLNQQAFAKLECEKELVVVPGAGHLFEEPGTLDEVVRLATAWFAAFLARGRQSLTDRHPAVEDAAVTAARPVAHPDVRLGQVFLHRAGAGELGGEVPEASCPVGGRCVREGARRIRTLTKPR
jgi:hypothetical protein